VDGLRTAAFGLPDGWAAYGGRSTVYGLRFTDGGLRPAWRLGGLRPLGYG